MKIFVSTFSTRTIRHFQVIGSFVSRTPFSAIIGDMIFLEMPNGHRVGECFYCKQDGLIAEWFETWYCYECWDWWVAWQQYWHFWLVFQHAPARSGFARVFLQDELGYLIASYIGSFSPPTVIATRYV
jgi:hypothetical protein